jgi:hypothetical protein
MRDPTLTIKLEQALRRQLFSAKLRFGGQRTVGALPQILLTPNAEKCVAGSGAIHAVAAGVVRRPAALQAGFSP